MASIIYIFKKTHKVTGFGKVLKVLSQRIPTGLMKQMNFSLTVLIWILVRCSFKKPNFMNTNGTLKLTLVL